MIKYDVLRQSIIRKAPWLDDHDVVRPSVIRQAL